MKQNKSDKIEQKILVILSSILIVFLLFSASFFLVLIDKGFYNQAFDKHGVYKEMGVEGVRDTVDYLINYLTSENTELNEIQYLFTPEEISHLNDVKHLVSWLKALSIGALVLLFAFIMRLNRLKQLSRYIRKILLISGIASLALLVIIFLLSINFTVFFDIFHKIFFPQGNYFFTTHHLLIKLFPLGFFHDYAKKMMFHILILSLIMIFLGSSSALAISNARRN